MSDGGMATSGVLGTADRDAIDAAMDAQEREQRFRSEIKNHLDVIGPKVLFEKLSSAYRYASVRAVLAGTISELSPTETLIAAYADTDGWDRVLLVIAAILPGDRRDA